MNIVLWAVTRYLGEAEGVPLGSSSLEVMWIHIPQAEAPVCGKPWSFQWPS